MATDSIARRRRPFLAPIWLVVLLAVIVAVVAFKVYQSAATTTVIVVPPAESAVGSIQNAPLIPEGEQRADQLAQLFGGIGPAGRIAAIYVNATRQTQQTAAPLAERLGLTPIVVAGDDVDATISRALSEHRGEAVMIVSSATSAALQTLTGITVPPRPADDHGSIYIVSVPLLGSAGVVGLHY
ncbi:MAG: hypothetical protein ACRETB_10925 [Steroidobacteraceae bacterium]